MSADRQRLQATLDELHQQLNDVDEIDPALREQLGSALRDIQMALQARAAGNPPAAGTDSVAQRLQEAAREFEENHPALSGTIGSLIDALGRMGI